MAGSQVTSHPRPLLHNYHTHITTSDASQSTSNQAVTSDDGPGGGSGEAPPLGERRPGQQQHPD